jgi:hypothetical protein
VNKFFEIVKTIDFHTAGYKTYLGLAMIVGALVAHGFGKIDEATFTTVVGVGSAIAGAGKVAADVRNKKPAEKPEEPPPAPPPSTV